MILFLIIKQFCFENLISWFHFDENNQFLNIEFSDFLIKLYFYKIGLLISSKKIFPIIYFLLSIIRILFFNFLSIINLTN